MKDSKQMTGNIDVKLTLSNNARQLHAIGWYACLLLQVVHELPHGETLAVGEGELVGVTVRHVEEGFTG